MRISDWSSDVCSSDLVGGALTFALQSRDTKPPAELYNTDNRAVTERVASGPRDYAALPPGVPQLGAPLPGDLGGPIVSAQQRGETVPLPPIGADAGQPNTGRSEEHTSEFQSLMRIPY